MLIGGRLAMSAYPFDKFLSACKVNDGGQFNLLIRPNDYQWLFKAWISNIAFTTSTQWLRVFGCYSGESRLSYRAIRNSSGSGILMSCGCNASNGSSLVSDKSDVTSNIFVGRGLCGYDDATVNITSSITTTLATSPNPFYIGTTSGVAFVLKRFVVKHWDIATMDWDVNMDLRPVLKDDVVYLYDTKNPHGGESADGLYPNIGTGSIEPIEESST